jgi:hypothetical protein
VLALRILGGAVFLVGAGGTALATWAAFNRPRPQDVGFAVLAPLMVVVALAGLLTLFVPGFF